MHSGLQLAAKQVNLGVGKVKQSAAVVEVEVRRDDVAHVARLEAQVADLRYGRLGDVDAWTNYCPEGPAELARGASVV